jgi:hypothetical protein
VVALEAVPVPPAERATTVIVYAVVFSRPVIVHVTAPVVVHVAPPGLAVAVYPVIPPPVSVGAFQATAAPKRPAVAVTAVGVPGSAGAVGTTAPEAADAAPSPTPFVAVTVKVYETPG